MPISQMEAIARRDEAMNKIAQVFGREVADQVDKQMYESTCDSPGIVRHYREMDYAEAALGRLRISTQWPGGTPQ